MVKSLAAFVAGCSHDIQHRYGDRNFVGTCISRMKSPVC
jgi:hypothetical protein